MWTEYQHIALVIFYSLLWSAVLLKRGQFSTESSEIKRASFGV